MKKRFLPLPSLVFLFALIWGITALARDIFRPLVREKDRYSLKVRVVMRKGSRPTVDVKELEERDSDLARVRVISAEANRVRFVVDDVLCEVVMEK